MIRAIIPLLIAFSATAVAGTQVPTMDEFNALSDRVTKLEAAATTPPTPPASFTISGGKILDPTGAAFRAYGIGIWGCGPIGQDQDAQHGGAALAQQLRTMMPGLNLIRLAFKQSCGVSASNQPSAYEAFINDMTSNHVFVVIEDHDTAFRVLSASTSPTLAQEHAWYAALANYYKSNTYVGFETMNEPGYPTKNGSAGEIQQIQDTYAAVRTDAGSTALLWIAAGQGDDNSVASLLDCNTGWCNRGAPSAALKAAIAVFKGIVWDKHWYNVSGSTVGAIQSTMNGAYGLGELQLAPSADGVIPTLSLEGGNSGDGTNIDANAAAGMQAYYTDSDPRYSGFTAWIWSTSPYGNADNMTTAPYTLPAVPTLTTYGVNVKCWVGRATVCPAP